MERELQTRMRGDGQSALIRSVKRLGSKQTSTCRLHLPRALLLCALSAALAAITVPAQAQISLLTAVTMAQSNSASVHAAQAQVAHAKAALSQSRDAYVPSLTAGSSAGYSYGFLGGVPSVFDAQIQSLVFSFSQPDYIRAAKAGLRAATLDLENAQEQVQLDSALDYLQLNTITQQLAALDEEKTYAARLDVIEQERLSAGVESKIAATRAELTAAQSDLQRIHLVAQAALLRKQLSDLTGLPLEDLQPEPETIPGAPIGAAGAPDGFTAGVQAGYSNAASKHYMAHGDARRNFRPQIGFGFSYQYLDTTLNNYNSFYSHPLQPNNFGLAAQITIPLFDMSLLSQAKESAADAVQADAQAEQGRQQAEEQTSQLRDSFPELRAQAHIANLQAKLAQQQLQAVLLQMKSPPTAPGAAAVTPADEMQARIEERSRYSDALDARFTLLKAQVSLLRVTGGLTAWIHHGAR
jgi:outer membrane protein TolC